MTATPCAHILTWSLTLMDHWGAGGTRNGGLNGTGGKIPLREGEHHLKSTKKHDVFPSQLSPAGALQHGHDQSQCPASTNSVMGWVGGGWGAAAAVGKPCLSTSSTGFPSLPSLGSSWQDAVWFQSFQWVLFQIFSSYLTGDDPFPREVWSVSLGRSQQQGKTRVKVKQKIVQFSLWREVVPRQLDEGLGDSGLLGLGGCMQPGWLRKSSSDSVDKGVVGWGAARGGGRAPRWAPVTEWTPRMSPGCRHGGCCCWSRCRSSGGWSSWPLLAAS